MYGLEKGQKVTHEHGYKGTVIGFTEDKYEDGRVRNYLVIIAVDQVPPIPATWHPDQIKETTA